MKTHLITFTSLYKVSLGSISRIVSAIPITFMKTGVYYIHTYVCAYVCIYIHLHRYYFIYNNVYNNTYVNNSGLISPLVAPALRVEAGDPRSKLPN